MELWIRSQNKEILANVDVLYVEKGKKYSDINDGYDITDDKYRYGRYETKERALEIISDMQHKLISLSDSMNRQLYIYEMPKE